MQELNIVFENDEYLVVNKPAGLLTHGSDRLVSGLLVIAKTQASFENLKKQFKERTIKKYYTALVYGKLLKDEGEINFPIRRSTKGHKMAAVPETDRGKPSQGVRKAKTIFSTIQKFINYTLLRIRIKTGRTHQIRVHMAAYGHPIVGDPIYNTKMTRIKNKKLNLERIFLVATELMFKDLGGKEQNFKIDLPKELQDFMKVVK